MITSKNPETKICKKCGIEKILPMMYKNSFRCKICEEISTHCIHKKRKNRCKVCPGSSEFCEHGNRKDRCRNCPGSPGFCEHDKRKNRCEYCKGSQLCIHKLVRSICKDCKGIRICEHAKVRSSCELCRPLNICKHDKPVLVCAECKWGVKCIHGVVKSECEVCTKPYGCVHGKRTFLCIICTPDSKYYCKKCRIYRVQGGKNSLCSECNPVTTKSGKTKELKVKEFLEISGYEFDHNVSCRDDKGYTFFPDFKIKSGDFWIIVECDERAHVNYPVKLEREREESIRNALKLNCVFIRFNIDKGGFKQEHKFSVLKETIDRFMGYKIHENLTEFLFY